MCADFVTHYPNLGLMFQHITSLPIGKLWPLFCYSFVGMKRMSNKQKRTRASSRTAQHAVWTSKQHKLDKARADFVRNDTAYYVRSSSAPLRQSEAFPEGERIASNSSVSEAQGNTAIFKPLKADDYVRYINARKRERSWYYRQGQKKRDGSFGLQKQKQLGVIETFLTMPKWWTRTLAAGIETGALDPGEVRKSLQRIGGTLLLRLCTRTGYEPIAFDVHPESQDNLHLHFSIASIDKDHRLIGRSANGKRGKKGLRLLNDCYMAIWRFSRYFKLPDELMHKPKLKFAEYDTEWDVASPKDAQLDDVFLSLCLDNELSRSFPGLSKKADTLAREQSTLWSKSIVPNETKAQLAKRLKASAEAEQKARTEASEERLRAAELEQKAARIRTEFVTSMSEMKAQLETEVTAMKEKNAELQRGISERDLRVERLRTKLKWAREPARGKD